ncbi:MAG: immunoglobulin-like domain-containing protein [Patescibacteria group bacterium]|jgi:hypothetical protein
MRKVSLLLVGLLALSAIGLVGCMPEKFIVSGDFYVQADDPRDDDYYLGSVDLTDEANMPVDYSDADYVVWNVDTVFSSGRTIPFDWTISKTGADPETSAPRIWQKGSNRAGVKMSLDGSRFGLIFDAAVGYSNSEGVGITTWTAQKSCLMATDWSGEGEGEGEAVPVITNQPDSLTANVGQQVQFTVGATGGNLKYCWQDNGIDITPNQYSGGVNSATLTIYSIGEINEGAYRCRVWNSQGSVYSDPAILTITNGSTGDTTPPVITLNGASTIYLSVGGSWVDPGATATDNVDGNLTSKINVTGTVNTAIAGTYHLTYTASDNSGNQASVTRTVIVGSIAPTSDLTIALTWNGSYLYLSATNAPASGIIGLELYQPSYPWIERETYNVSSAGLANGTVTKFRFNVSRTIRFSVVTNASSGGYVANDAVTITLNGATVPLVNDGNGNWAFQAAV